jgi:hypothetical protein
VFLVRYAVLHLSLFRIALCYPPCNCDSFCCPETNITFQKSTCKPNKLLFVVIVCFKWEFCFSVLQFFFSFTDFQMRLLFLRIVSLFHLIFHGNRRKLLNQPPCFKMKNFRFPPWKLLLFFKNTYYVYVMLKRLRV